MAILRSWVISWTTTHVYKLFVLFINADVYTLAWWIWISSQIFFKRWIMRIKESENNDRCMLVEEDWSCFIVSVKFLLFLSTYQLQAQADWSVITFMDNVKLCQPVCYPLLTPLLSPETSFLYRTHHYKTKYLHDSMKLFTCLHDECEENKKCPTLIYVDLHRKSNSCEWSNCSFTNLVLNDPFSVLLLHFAWRCERFQ